MPPHLPRDRNKEHQVDVGPRRSSPKDEAVLENGERQGGGGALGKGASDPGTIQRRISGEGAGVKRKQQLGAWERRAQRGERRRAGRHGEQLRTQRARTRREAAPRAAGSVSAQAQTGPPLIGRNRQLARARRYCSGG